MNLLNAIWGHRKLKDVEPGLSSAELRRRVKIVVIDDEEDSFPCKLLRDDGYTIEWWQNIDARGLQRLENGDFDIIILDIMGVAGAEVSSTDGIGVLKRVKSVNPNQVVVAFSGQSFDLSKTEFWRLADDALTKPVTIIRCKELLDRLTREKITLSGYWRAISELMRASAIPERRIAKLEREFSKAIAEKDSGTLESLCQRLPTGLSNAAAITTLIQAVGRLWI